ncbi:hypothetical protein FRC07_007074, partial [Ceratobasidium sp. 392]
MNSFPELRGHLFCDLDFVKKYLSVDSVKLKTALDRCAPELDAFRFPEARRESEFYEPIASVLNTIKQATETDPEESYPLPFVDVHSEPIPSHEKDTDGIRPDLVMFEMEARHWETVRMTVEVKAKSTHLKVGMKKLAEYARMMFVNQLDRRHVYGLVICNWAATFVRFDRSGVLYSKPIDMRDQREEFRTAFAGLMLLDEGAIGYDTAFTTRMNHGQMEYYIDLPASTFSSDAGRPCEGTPGLQEVPGEPSDSPTITMKVIRLIYYRASIRGRGTTVLIVRHVMRPGFSDWSAYDQYHADKPTQTAREERLAEGMEVLGTRDYVLRMAWRDPDHIMEGEVLERMIGEYGVGQYVWHGDVFKACDSPGCLSSMESSCGKCVDRTPYRGDLGIIENLTDLDIDVPKETEGDGEIKYREIKTDEYSKASVKCTSLVYSRLLTSTVGTPLCSAKGPRELLEAILDATLVNMGLLHRDISDGNVMILKGGRGYNERKWKLPRTTMSEEGFALEKSERLLRETLDRLNRDPVGMLNDFDLSTTDSSMGVEFFGGLSSTNEPNVGKHRPKQRKLSPKNTASPAPPNLNKGEDCKATTADKAKPTHLDGVGKDACHGTDFRTGTPTFMSIRVLKTRIGTKYEHHFMDDLESFFWLILWCIAGHVDPG